MFNHILLLCGHADNALSAAALHFECPFLQPLDIAGFRNSDDYLFIGNEVFVGKLAELLLVHFGAALVCEEFFYILQLFPDYEQYLLRVREQVRQVRYRFTDHLQFIFDFPALESSEAFELHIEYCLRLKIAQLKFRH